MLIDAFTWIVDKGGLQYLNTDEVISIMDSRGCTASQADFRSAETFQEYLDEYGKNNFLERGWYGDVDEAFDEFIGFLNDIDY